LGALFNSVIVTPLTEILNALSGLAGYGVAIILLTAIIRLITLPLTFQSLRSSKAMQELQPKLQELQKKHGKDREKMAQEQMKLYKEAGVNPLAGCLPMIIQMPVWIGLYQALRQMAIAGVLHEGFLWIPSLAEPNGWPLPDPMWAYLVLPIFTVITQFVVQRMMSTPSSDPQQSVMNQMMLMMPLMFGFFAIQVPSGLALYWVTSNLFQLVQQYFTTGWGNLLPQRPAAKQARATKVAPGDKGIKKNGRRKKKR